MRRRIYAISRLRRTLFVSILRELNLARGSSFTITTQSGHPYLCYRFHSLLTLNMFIAHIHIFSIWEKRDNIFFLYLLSDPNMYVYWSIQIDIKQQIVKWTKEKNFANKKLSRNSIKFDVFWSHFSWKEIFALYCVSLPRVQQSWLKLLYAELSYFNPATACTICWSTVLRVHEKSDSVINYQYAAWFLGFRMATQTLSVDAITWLITETYKILKNREKIFLYILGRF